MAVVYFYNPISEKEDLISVEQPIRGLTIFGNYLLTFYHNETVDVFNTKERTYIGKVKLNTAHFWLCNDKIFYKNTVFRFNMYLRPIRIDFFNVRGRIRYQVHGDCLAFRTNERIYIFDEQEYRMSLTKKKNEKLYVFGGYFYYIEKGCIHGTSYKNYKGFMLRTFYFEDIIGIWRGKLICKDNLGFLSAFKVEDDIQLAGLINVHLKSGQIARIINDALVVFENCRVKSINKTNSF